MSFLVWPGTVVHDNGGTGSLVVDSTNHDIAGRGEGSNFGDGKFEIGDVLGLEKGAVKSLEENEDEGERNGQDAAGAVGIQETWLAG